MAGRSAAGGGAIGTRTKMTLRDLDNLRRCKPFGAEPAPRPFRAPARADALSRDVFQRMQRATLNEYGNPAHESPGRRRDRARGRGRDRECAKAQGARQSPGSNLPTPLPTGASIEVRLGIALERACESTGLSWDDALACLRGVKAKLVKL